MTAVIASAQLLDGNVLSFRAFPTLPYLLSFTITFHIEGDMGGEIAYRVRKWDDVIHQTDPIPFRIEDTEGEKLLTYADRIEVAFPSQGSYLLDILVDGSVLYSVRFSVFDNSKRTELEREIIYYLKAKRGARSVQEITKGVFNPKILNKANMGEMSGRVYFALLRMKEVMNLNPQSQGSLEDGMKRSRWQLKD